MPGMDEDRAREIILNLNSHLDNKDNIKLVLLRQRLSRIRSLSSTVARQEDRAIRLLTIPNYSNILPYIQLCNQSDYPLWDYLRNVLSSAPWRNRPGRLIKLFVIDINSGGILGVIDLGSEVLSLGPRDIEIGWNREIKCKKGGLNRIINLGSCVPSQPFGWLCGGKFIAEGCSTRDIANIWLNKYGDSAACISTTSLYGKSSQYNRLDNWRYLGLTSGTTIHSVIMDNELHFLRDFLKSRNIKPRKRQNWGCGAVYSVWSIVEQAARYLNIKQTDVGGGCQRGCYLSELYNGAINDLRDCKISGAPERELEKITDWWLSRWYLMRYPKVIDKINTFNYDVYRYGNIINASVV